jgi:hypothetical protein
MTIREKVARAICEADAFAPEPDDKIYIKMRIAKAWQGRTEMGTAAITAFLEAAAEPDEQTGVSWHMRPDEATEAIIRAGKKVKFLEPDLSTGYPDKIYRAMLAAAPEFEWDK